MQRMQHEGKHLWRMLDKNDWKEVLMIQKQLPRDEEVELEQQGN